MHFFKSSSNAASRASEMAVCWSSMSFAAAFISGWTLPQEIQVFDIDKFHISLAASGWQGDFILFWFRLVGLGIGGLHLPFL